MDCSPPGSSVHGISQARILEWVAISYSRGSSWPRDQTHISYISCIGRWILYCWAIKEAPIDISYILPNVIYNRGKKNIFKNIYLTSFFMFIFVHVKNSFKYQMWASLVVQLVKNLPAMWETWVQSLDWEDALEEGMATHSSFLAWRIPRTEEPGGLQSMESQRVEHVWVTKHTCVCGGVGFQ